MTFAIYDADTHDEVVGMFKDIQQRTVKLKVEELIDKGASNYYISSFEKCDHENECTQETINLDEYLEKVDFR